MPKDVPVPEAAGIDASWLTSVLIASAAAPSEARVVAMRPVRLPGGKLARTIRFLLTWADDDSRGPASLIGKFPADGARSQQTGQATDAYALELAFYRLIAPTAQVAVPRCHFAGIDPATGRFALILDDIGSARKVDQVAGATADEVAAALVEVSRLHAQYWAGERSESLRWVPLRAAPANARRLAAAYRLLYGRFLDRFGGRLSDRAAGMIERFDTVIRRWSSHDDPPYTLLHGDYRAGNLLFGSDAVSPPVTVLDWQNLGIGSGVSDVAYLIGGSLPIDTRRNREEELLAAYLGALSANGVVINDREYRNAYRVNALTGLHMTVVSAMLVDGGADSDELFVTMAERHAAHADDVNAQGALT
ncbi:MAG TPA: phosphotransferase [Streptosporangiaceae bacterium]|nr:phosphotransferase [Streptosporangiaceae bacterium]